MVLVLQYFQSNSESISNGICILLALVSVKLYTSFDFNCPCMPQYNRLYSLGVMVVPPIIFFFLGMLVNRHTGVMMDEWLRPEGNRSKNPAIVKYEAIGWSILLFFIVLGALARIIKPFFDDHARFLQTRYWSNYLDVEQKMFDETCVLHARDFARKCVVQFFEEMREDSVPVLNRPYFTDLTVNTEDNWDIEEEDRLHGITRQERMNQLLDKWYYSKPQLDVRRIANQPRLCPGCHKRSLSSDV
ncbi:calcium homeostasis modulator protein 3-like [Eucyclogobius newberryi]|uniref:calcium homeostasis modulator protein 3-like n=1 Tax=Eucyclogobius newberryi TaxID=166745 RepID=UPI003B5CA952